MRKEDMVKIIDGQPAVLGELFPAFGCDRQGPLYAVVWDEAMATAVFNETPYIRFVICLRLPEARMCASLAHAAEFYREKGESP